MENVYIVLELSKKTSSYRVRCLCSGSCLCSQGLFPPDSCQRASGAPEPETNDKNTHTQQCDKNAAVQMV